MAEPSGSKDAPAPRRQSTEREVLDPVAHLPVIIHDNTDAELDRIQPVSPSSNDPKAVLRDCMSGVVYEELIKPRWQVSPTQAKTQMAIFTGLAVVLGSSASLLLFWISGPGGRYGWPDLFRASAVCTCAALAASASVMLGPSIRHEDHTPHENDDNEGTKPSESPESAAWLNSMLQALWPLVNSSLFVSISDMIEDTLQASLPKMINGVRVADLGQGSEPLRILGIRAIPQGDEGANSDGSDYINLEVAIAYRAQSIDGGGKNLKGRARNAHLLMEFWMAGSVKLPVWVELSGLIATARIRLQLTPNPPFFSSMTLTLLGQPKVAMKCTPLAKSFLDIMDIPGLSSWMHESINAGISAYVAPRSLTLDLKAMLSGKDMMDTEALGVIIVNVKRAFDFRDGDGGKVWHSKDERTGDAYVTVGWAKWGKPIWSTRIIENEKQPVWDETNALLVTPAELNAREKLRLQLWDSDRFTADDLLGVVEIPLLDIMHNTESHNTVVSRQDSLTGGDGDQCPGTLEWAYGYFSKTTVEQQASIDQQHVDRVMENVKHTSMKQVENGVRDSEELKPLEKEDFKEQCDEIIASSPPSHHWASGLLSIRIGQIDGLEIPNPRASGVKTNGGETEDSDDLPSTYCTIILNHQRIYKTRTKMKNSKPYFSAGTERFIRDWSQTIVMVAVRDSRMHEPDPLLGVVVLPLRRLLQERSQVQNSLPLVGGIGCGRLQFTLLFRSIQAALPRPLIGWDVGTLDIQPSIRPSTHLPPDLQTCKLIVRTLYSKGKLHPHQDGYWQQKKGRSLRLAVNKRYSSCLLIMLRKKVLGPDQTPAFATIWLKDIPDDEDLTLTIPVRRNVDSALSRARFNATEVGEAVGELSLKLRFWPGLSGYHKNLSDHDANMSDVMDVLDSAEQTDETENESLYVSESSSDSSDEASSSGSTRSGLLGELKNYRKQKGDLHRKHRGLMQWRAARHLAWIGRGVENRADEVTSKVSGRLKHRQFDGGIETEV